MKSQTVLILLCICDNGPLRNILITLGDVHFLFSKDKYRMVDTRNHRVFLSSDTIVQIQYPFQECRILTLFCLCRVVITSAACKMKHKQPLSFLEKVLAEKYCIQSLPGQIVNNLVVKPWGSALPDSALLRGVLRCSGAIKALRGWKWLLLYSSVLQSVHILFLINLNEMLSTHL